MPVLGEFRVRGMPRPRASRPPHHHPPTQVKTKILDVPAFSGVEFTQHFVGGYGSPPGSYSKCIHGEVACSPRPDPALQHAGPPAGRVCRA